MPSLVVFNNPGELQHQEIDLVETMSFKVRQLKYEHDENGKNYYHDFDAGVEMIAVASFTGEKQILLRHTNGKPLWEDLD